MTSAAQFIAKALSLSLQNVHDTIALLGEGATVPFIARYRKERTGNLDEVQIQQIKLALDTYNELAARKVTILKTLTEIEKLTPELQAQIDNCMDKLILEDIYLPYKPRKMTRADKAIEQGLQPLADIMLAGKLLPVSKDKLLAQYLNDDKIKTTADAVSGAKDIIAEHISSQAENRLFIRNITARDGVLTTTVAKDWKDKPSKYEMYYNFSGSLRQSPAHRVLAIRRAAVEKVIGWKIDVDSVRCIEFLNNKTIPNKQAPFFSELVEAVEDSYKRLIFPSIENECFNLKVVDSEKESIAVFAGNLKNLLLAPPAGASTILGVDPGFRTGCKCAIIDETGTFKEYLTIFPTQDSVKAEKDILKLFSSYAVKYVAIGNGTASKETETFVKSVITNHQLTARAVLVNESGASIYSASDVAREEFPSLDLTIRGAISIARRLQDPLAELIKIDPKSIGVGQYQHDVDQGLLKESLDFIVEQCVNHVGVDLNTASFSLLSHVSGIGPGLAKNIVAYRHEIGAFESRIQLKKVAKLGAKAFEQCAGFLRIRQSKNPLDNTAIHPESYGIVKSMAVKLGVPIDELIKQPALVDKITLSDFVTDSVGLPTLRDIVSELKKPGRDPRAEFQYASFRDDINEISDLHEGLILNGIVTNVTNFGAFVDIGVHQDGLIHISQLSESFVKDPATVIAVGESVSVKVLEVDAGRKRISLKRL
jgi:uncharacterized protein